MLYCQIVQAANVRDKGIGGFRSWTRRWSCRFLATLNVIAAGAEIGFEGATGAGDAGFVEACSAGA